MKPVDGHYQLSDFIKDEDQLKQWLRKAYEEGLPVAIPAYGKFAQSGTVLDDGTMEYSGKPTLMKRGWLYVDPDALLELSMHDESGIGMYRSRPDSSVDIWAMEKGGEKPTIRRDALWFPQELMETIEEITGKNEELSTRERNTLLSLIAVLLHKCGIEPNNPGEAKRIAGLTEEFGTPISTATIKRKVLDRLPDAMESRKK
jgi:hypothetical protein